MIVRPGRFSPRLSIGKFSNGNSSGRHEAEEDVRQRHRVVEVLGEIAERDVDPVDVPDPELAEGDVVAGDIGPGAEGSEQIRRESLGVEQEGGDRVEHEGIDAGGVVERQVAQQDVGLGRRDDRQQLTDGRAGRARDEVEAQVTEEDVVGRGKQQREQRADVEAGIRQEVEAEVSERHDHGVEVADCRIGLGGGEGREERPDGDGGRGRAGEVEPDLAEQQVGLAGEQGRRELPGRGPGGEAGGGGDLGERGARRGHRGEGRTARC